MRKKTILLLFLLTLSIYASNINIQLTAEENNYRPNSLEFIPHDPIFILSDSGFEVFPGTGIAEDPYVIEGYNITTTDNIGIYIYGTTKYFIVRNCYVDAVYFSIYIHNVADGTATVINNTCNNNVDCGIVLDSSSSSTVANNTCNNNNNYGILLWESSGSTIASNTCENNDNYEGISLQFSDSSTVANNSCNNNGREGIKLRYSDYSNVTKNTCNNNGEEGIILSYSGYSNVTNNTCNNNGGVGIWLLYSGYSNVTKNTCNNNNYWGIGLSNSDFCVITYNLLKENERYGIVINSVSDNCTIHYNTLVENQNLVGASQAFDDGANNTWYDTATLEGNYWSDWSGTGYYSIDGSANSEDLYPLDEPTVYPGPPVITNIIHSPSSPTELDTIGINATVTSPYDVQSVTLHYRINDGSWQTISMTLISGDIYSITIGSFAVSDTIEYYVSAIDNSSNHNEATEDNGGLFYVLTVGSSDITGPIIGDIINSPAIPTELDTISINATVTDDSGVQSVTLYYRVNSGTWIEVSMTLVSGEFYSVTIGSFTVSDIIEYYISAVDNSINNNEATEDNGGLYYALTVGSSDVTSPGITNVIHSPSTPTELDTISINATITDSSGVQSVTLYYRINGGTWQTISMTLVSGALYSVIIGPYAISDNIEYYITAVDNSLNYNEATEDNSGLYYSFTVSEVIPEFQTLSLLLPAIAFLFLVFGLVVLQRRKK